MLCALLFKFGFKFIGSEMLKILIFLDFPQMKMKFNKLYQSLIKTSSKKNNNLLCAKKKYNRAKEIMVEEKIRIFC